MTGPEPPGSPRPPVRVLLLCGGSSDEHQVSLASARSVLQAVAAGNGRLEVTPLVVTREGAVVPPGESAGLLAGESGARAALADESGERGAALADEFAERGAALAGESADGAALAPGRAGRARDVGGSLAAAAAKADVVFPLLHGPNGEDGSVQGLLQLMGLPFVGSGVLGSAVAMDKLTMKALFAAAGLPQVAYRGVSRHAYRTDAAAVLAELAGLGLPVFVKPANLGSSIGISRVDDARDLPDALETALAYDRRAIVEAAAEGARELELAVLGNDEPEVSGVGEIVYENSFYDYDTKYTDGRADLVIPARVPAEVEAAARRLALEAFACLDAAGLARVDLFYLPDGRLLVNELNTMPGFTRHSMYPKLWQAAGVGYPELIERLVLLALEPR